MAEKSRRKAKKVPQRKAKKVPQKKAKKVPQKKAVEVPWRKAVEIIRPHVVKILTPHGSGTGFLCAYTKDRKFCSIATASHVISQSHFWEEPIRIRHYDSGKIKLLREPDRVILLNTEFDTAVILFKEGIFPLPDKTLPFIPKGKYLKVGEEIGWVGFPAVSPKNLCFFSGRNSCRLGKNQVYLVDGVAINGVSGGPVFYTTGRGIRIIGSVSAYLPNIEGATPGLAVIRDVDHGSIKAIKNWKEAKKKETPPHKPKGEKAGEK